MRYYEEVFARRSKQELRLLAHIKRAMECIIGDPEFRRQVEEQKSNWDVLLRDRGVEGVDLRSLVIFRDGKLDLNWPDNELSKYPLAKLWADYVAELRGIRAYLREHGNTPERNPRFHAWRQRQISRCDSQLGDKDNKALVHPLFAFELTKGCSVGCWFCGFAAEKLQGVFPYTRENAALWRGLLQVGADLFGPAVQCGNCYWATEPADNPDYLDFVRDFRRITGEMPQTTTALPLRDVEWTRRVIRMQEECLSVPVRFSVLSVGILRRIHEIFSPEELLRVELLHQHRDSIYAKAQSGRALQKRRRATRSDESDKRLINVPGRGICQTIACLSGFLVNMVDRRIQLISPCNACNQWPLGYRVHAEGRFANASEFRDFIVRVVEECMPESIGGEEVAAFRKDLAYAPLPDGFSLANESILHKFTGETFLARLGKLIHDGRRTVGEIMDLILEDGADFFGAAAAIQELFDRGLLDDEALICRQRQEVKV
ncbi:MAG: radical SAM family RiPP maturation amino acid epimerase [Planctomycetota bacterium]